MIFSLTLKTILFLIGTAGAIEQPIAPKEQSITWKHGIRMADPYLWMENDHDPRLQDWIAKQNAYTNETLASDLHAELSKEFRALLEKKAAEDFSDEVQELFDKEQRFHNHRLSPRFSSQLDSIEDESPAKTYKVVFTSDSGSDFKTLRIKNAEEDKFLPDLLQVKFAQLFWAEDEKSFIYSTDRDSRLGSAKPVIRRHVLGTAQKEDKVLFEAPTHDTWLALRRRGDDRWILGLQNRETTRYAEINFATGDLNWLWEEKSDAFVNFAVEKDSVYQISIANADRGEIVVRDQASGEAKQLIPETDMTIDLATRLKGDTYVTYIDNGAHRLFRYQVNPETSELKSTEIKLPSRGAVFPSADEETLKVVFQSYTQPSQVLKYEPATEALTVVKEGKQLDVDLESKLLQYVAHNGENVPVWITYRKGLVLDSNTPVYLWGYGGFGVNVMPRFRDSLIPWYKRGGVFAVVTLPGGRELGWKWMQDGQLYKKKNVFDDFAQAATMLTEKQIGSRSTHAIGGGSNGGLLVGATANLYPSFFAAAIPEVGVLDLTKFQNFTGGKWWMTDYGNRNIRSEFRLQLSLSPFHNIKRRSYPATLTIAADHDDRVVPSHSYRYHARLQTLQRSNNPVLLHTRVNASHGSTATVDEKVRYLANKFTFLIQQTGKKVR